MTIQSMNNELTLDQLDAVSGGNPAAVAFAAGVAAGFTVTGAALVGVAIGVGIGIATSGVKADDEGNGDYRRGPDTSNSPQNPFG